MISNSSAPPPGPPPTVDDGFICDTMFGKMARWMRFCGIDTLYPDVMDDSSLADLAREKGRVLVTRDKQFAFRKNLRAIVLSSEDGEEGLSELFKALGVKVKIDAGNIVIDGRILDPRCSLCNEKLAVAGKDEVKGDVPPGVLEKNEQFFRCPSKSCGKVFWKGSHWDDIGRRLERA